MYPSLGKTNSHVIKCSSKPGKLTFEEATSTKFGVRVKLKGKLAFEPYALTLP